MPDITTRCCIAGGGPAGMMLGFLLARAGIDVVVLEKHADFLRDFRGDTVHPSTMQVMHELGLLDAFLARPHSEVRTLAVQIGERVHPGRRLHPPADAGEVRRLHAAMGFPRFPRRSGKALSDVPPADADRGHRPDPRRRPHGRRDRARPGRRAGDQCPTDHCRRRPPLHACATRRVSRSIDRGAPMDVLWLRLSKSPNDPGADARPHRRRPHLHHAGSQRLLAMRLRHPQGRHRRGARARPGGVPRRDRAAGAVSARPRAGTRLMGRCEAADRGGEPAGHLVSPWPAVHRRCRACDVAGRRRWDQPGDPGRGRHRQHPGAAAARGRCDAG